MHTSWASYPSPVCTQLRSTSISGGSKKKKKTKWSEMKKKGREVSQVVEDFIAAQKPANV